MLLRVLCGLKTNAGVLMLLLAASEDHDPELILHDRFGETAS